MSASWTSTNGASNDRFCLRIISPSAASSTSVRLVPPVRRRHPTAAKLSGINTSAIVFLLYVIVGVVAALAGIARSSFMSLGGPLSGDGMELSAILVVLLGGTAFSGGEGRVLRSFIGALIIMALTVGMLTLVPAYFQTLVIGAALLAAAASNHLISRKVTAS